MAWAVRLWSNILFSSCTYVATTRAHRSDSDHHLIVSDRRKRERESRAQKSGAARRVGAGLPPGGSRSREGSAPGRRGSTAAHRSLPPANRTGQPPLVWSCLFSLFLCLLA